MLDGSAISPCRRYVYFTRSTWTTTQPSTPPRRYIATNSTKGAHPILPSGTFFSFLLLVFLFQVLPPFSSERRSAVWASETILLSTGRRMYNSISTTARHKKASADIRYHSSAQKREREREQFLPINRSSFVAIHPIRCAFNPILSLQQFACTGAKSSYRIRTGENQSTDGAHKNGPGRPPHIIRAHIYIDIYIQSREFTLLHNFPFLCVYTPQAPANCPHLYSYIRRLQSSSNVACITPDNSHSVGYIESLLQLDRI